MPTATAPRRSASRVSRRSASSSDRAAPVTLDYANCLSDRVGPHGLPPQVLTEGLSALEGLTSRLRDTRGTGWERWRDLPLDPMRTKHVTAVKQLVRKLRGTQNLLVLGIGGSALGNIALHSALTPVTYNLLPRNRRKGPRLFVLDNVDPYFVGDVLEEIRRSDPKFKKTVVNVISKSGETAETAAQFLVLREMLRRKLGKRGYAKHIVAITDPERGTMREICAKEGYATLPVPEGVGGRFSVLSPVGLFSAAMCNIDIDSLLDGAAAMDQRCSGSQSLQNPAALLAYLLTELAKRGKPIHVLMPYCNALYSLADWYRQLWAESLGKQVDLQGNRVDAGPTPVKALGTTDQHSQVQLYREGPNDKVIGFLEVD